MCDIYMPKCGHKNCSIYLDVHIADFCVPRSSVRLYCSEKHVPEGYEGTLIVFSPIKGKKYIIHGEMRNMVVIHKNPEKFPIGCLHHNGKHGPCLHNIEDAVTPNSGGDYETTVKHKKAKKQEKNK